MDSKHLAPIASLFVVGGLVSVLTVACGSNSPTTDQPPVEEQEAGPPVTDSGPTPQQDSNAPPPDTGPFIDAGPCVPKPVDCTDKCGPVRDQCSGEITLCGGCPTGQVCDLALHTCGVPKVTCQDFNAECGTIKTSCGEYKSCGFCPAGKECNPDTNKCVPANTVTCADLGYECGLAWLGSGDPTVKTNCGSCSDPSRPRCNAAYNVCEPSGPIGPTCAPWKAAGLTGAQQTAAKKAFCDAARAAKGVECGTISDGCGGVIDCTLSQGFSCPAGQGCGVRGVANRCEPSPTPPECETLGMNCGTITSTCTGKKISCGVCGNAGEVCNDNNVCGPPCTPQTCATALPAGQQCGTPPDGCKGTLNCKCAAGGKCQNHQCCTPKTCAQLVQAGQCGNNLPDGCGGTVDCGCNGGQTCTAPNGQVGSCCQRKTCGNDYPGQCGSNLDDGCGGTIDCNCGGGQTCIQGTAPNGTPTPNGQTGTCCAEGASCPGGTCNTTVPSTCIAGQTFPCNCPGGQQCNGNTCCSLPDCNGACNTDVSNACGTRHCDCGGGQICLGNNTCCSPLNCGNFAGQCGTFSDNCGGTLNCGCNLPFVCSNPSGNGTCGCTAYDCNSPQYAGLCGTFDNGCLSTINCNPCNGSQTCNPNNNQCCTPETCAANHPGACGTFSNGCGGTLNCNCTGFNKCGGGGTPGVCGCTPKKAPQDCVDANGNAIVGTFADGCGGQYTCAG